MKRTVTGQKFPQKYNEIIAGMSSSAYVLRIFTEEGLYRLSISANGSLTDLYEAIYQKCRIEHSAEFDVFLDADHLEKLENVSHIPISSLVSNGQCLYIKRGGSSKGSTSAKASCQSAQQLVSSVISPENEFQQSANSHFVSFDYFLSCREFNTLDLPLSKSFKPQPLRKGSVNTIPAPTTLKHQSYRPVDHIEFRNVEEMNKFVNYWAYEGNMAEQRAGFLYGFYAEDPHYSMGIRAVVEAIYEPPQMDQHGRVILVQDPQKEVVDRLAKTLGLECVGYIFTHLPREELLSSEDVIHIAKFQLEAIQNAPRHYTGYPVSPFVSVTMSQDIEKKSFQTNAFIVSDLGMALVRDDLLIPSEDGVKLLVKEHPPNVLSQEILEGGKPVKSIDPHWFFVRVNDSAPKKVESLFKSWSFPSENRKHPCDAPTLLNHLSKVVKDPLEIYADFHFILYISNIFSEETAQLLCKSVTTGRPLDSSVVEMFNVLQASAY